MTARTATIAGICLASVCFAATVAQAYEVKMEDAKISNYHTGGDTSASTITPGANVKGHVIDPSRSRAASTPLPVDQGTKLRSLNGVDAVDGMFQNRQGIGQTTGPQLPAVGSARESARSGGGVGTAAQQRPPTAGTLKAPTPASVPTPLRDVGDLNTGKNIFGAGGNSAAGKTGGPAATSVKTGVKQR